MTATPGLRDAAALSDVELALLNGGPELAALTAATRLRHRSSADLPGVATTDLAPLADTADGLERELFEALRDAPGRPAAVVLAELAAGDAVVWMQAALQRVGLLRDGTPTRRGRRLIRQARNDLEAHGTIDAAERLSRAVALGGGAVLWSADPAFAREHEVPLRTLTAEYGYEVEPKRWPNSKYTTP